MACIRICPELFDKWQNFSDTGRRWIVGGAEIPVRFESLLKCAAELLGMFSEHALSIKADRWAAPRMILPADRIFSVRQTRTGNPELLTLHVTPNSCGSCRRWVSSSFHSARISLNSKMTFARQKCDKKTHLNARTTPCVKISCNHTTQIPQTQITPQPPPSLLTGVSDDVTHCANPQSIS